MGWALWVHSLIYLLQLLFYWCVLYFVKLEHVKQILRPISQCLWQEGNIHKSANQWCSSQLNVDDFVIYYANNLHLAGNNTNQLCEWHPSRNAYYNPDNKVHGANMGPTWVLSAPDGPHVGPINLAIREFIRKSSKRTYHQWRHSRGHFHWQSLAKPTLGLGYRYVITSTRHNGEQLLIHILVSTVDWFWCYGMDE